MVATSCTERLRGSRASPNEGPATKGRTTQATAVAHRPKCWVAVVIGAEICPTHPSGRYSSDVRHTWRERVRTGPRRDRRGRRAAGSPVSGAARVAVGSRRVTGGSGRRPMTPRTPTSRCPSGCPPASATCPTATPATPSSSSCATTPGCRPRRRSRPGRGGRGWSPRRPPGIQGVTVHDDGTLDLDPTLVDPEAPLGDLDFAGDAYGGLRAFLTAVADRDGPDQGLAHRAGHPRRGAARRRARRRPRLRGGRSPRCAAGPRRWSTTCCGGCRRPSSWCSSTSRRWPASPSTGFPIGPTEGVDLVSGALAVVEQRRRHRPALLRTRPTTGCCSAPGPASSPSPSTAGIERHAGLLGDHLDRGGWVAWGAVPTDGPVGPHGRAAVAAAVGRCGATSRPTGATRSLLRTNAMITPVCGLSHHGVTQAEQVMELTDRLASRLQDQAIGVRLAAGA